MGTQETITPRLLTKGEAAEALRCSERTIDRLRERGSLPTVKVGRKKVLIRESDVRALIGN